MSVVISLVCPSSQVILKVEVVGLGSSPEEEKSKEVGVIVVNVPAVGSTFRLQFWAAVPLVQTNSRDFKTPLASKTLALALSTLPGAAVDGNVFIRVVVVVADESDIKAN